MVAANLVHRDFEADIRNYGDVVHTRRPGQFKIRRKTDLTTITQQDAVATLVNVPLDQWFYTSFIIKDGEMSKSFQDLVTAYLLPAMQTIARSIDRIVLGQIHKYLSTNTKRVGRLGSMDGTNAKQFVLEARQVLNENKAPTENRNVILSPASETAFLSVSEFTKVNERGDGGQALENARIGRIFGFDTFMDQNVNALVSGADAVTGWTVNNSGGYPAGTTALTVADVSATMTVGEYVTIAGDDQPRYLVTGTDVSGDTTAITINEGLKYAVANDAAITQYLKCVVNGTSFTAGYSETVNVDGYTTGKAPQVGQLITFVTGGTRHTYTILEATDNGSTCDIILDRPLEATLTNDTNAFPGPYGSFNWVIHPEALALVTRPVASPPADSGVRSSSASYNGVGMRVSMQYSLPLGGLLVNLDLLAGVAVLDPNLAVVLLG